MRTKVIEIEIACDTCSDTILLKRDKNPEQQKPEMERLPPGWLMLYESGQLTNITHHFCHQLCFHKWLLKNGYLLHSAQSPIGAGRIELKANSPDVVARPRL